MCAETMTQERIYTVTEIAEILRLTPRTVRRMIVSGELDAFMVRGEYRIRKSALDALMQKKPKQK